MLKSFCHVTYKISEDIRWLFFSIVRWCIFVYIFIRRSQLDPHLLHYRNTDETFCSKSCSLFLAPENFVLTGYWICNSFIRTLFWTTLFKCRLHTLGTWIKLCLSINIDMIMCARECMMFSCETFHCATHGRQINYICDGGGIRPLTEICSQVPKPITTNHRLCQSDCDPFSDCLHLTRRALCCFTNSDGW